MGNQSFPTRHNGQTIDESWFNLIEAVLAGIQYPRNTSGVVQDESGSLRDASNQFLRLYAKVGQWSIGDVKMHHSFNGAVSAGQGWMKCDGSQITQAAYDAQHTAGDWNKYIGSSALTNKYLPAMNGRYPIGITTTTQDGSVALTPVGNASSQINLSHTHPIPDHNHTWWGLDSVPNEPNCFFRPAGSPNADVTGGTYPGGVAGTGIFVGNGLLNSVLDGTFYTDTITLATTSALSSTQDIRPDSMQFEFWMRII